MKVRIASIVVLAATAKLLAGVSYGTPGATYLQDFNGLPLAPAPGGTSGTALSNNTVMAAPGAGYTTGWVNDSDYTGTTDAKDIGLKGWYLYHGVFNAASYLATAGPSRHSYFIQGGGTTSGTGGFWAFNSGTSTTDPAYAEKALGSVPTSVSTGSFSNLTNPMRIALELVNTSGSTLTSFTLTYDGEQYMDGRSATAGALSFFYSVAGDTAAHWNLDRINGTFTSADTWGTRTDYGYKAVADLNFTAPANTYVAASGPAEVRDGNLAANRRADISATVEGIAWAPDTSLWLMWEHGFIASGQSDGLAIDNVRFSALPSNFIVPEPTALAPLALAAALLPRRRRHSL